MFLYIKEYRKRGDCLVSNALKITNVLGITRNDLLTPPPDAAE